METSDVLRHEMIKHLMAQHTDNVADAAINLWEQMAVQIISIVGKGGFNSLYARSVFITQATFPWLEVRSVSSQAEHPFTELRMSFQGQESAQVIEANSVLLITFTDILVSLIGEQLTTRILHSAWGNDASIQADKDLT